MPENFVNNSIKYMKKISRIFLVFSLLFAFSAISANAQITSISQVKDVKPGDKHYEALRSLVEVYGVFEPLEGDTFRANDPLTREQFIIMLNEGLDQLMEVAAAEDESISTYELIQGYSANNTNITSISSIKDIKASYSYYDHLQSLVERYGIDICDADKNFRPAKTVTEKEFYTWITNIFGAKVGGNPSAVKAITRSEFAIVMNAAFDSVVGKIGGGGEAEELEKRTGLIKNLPSKGRAQITNYLKSYLPDNTCINFSGADADLKLATDKGGIWNDYKIKNGDTGDIVFETTNSCQKGEKLVLLRVGTAIVTMNLKGIKKLK